MIATIKIEPRFNTYWSYPIGDLDKTFAELLTANPNVSPEQKAWTLSMTDQWVVEADPYSEDPDNPDYIPVPYTIRELALLLNNSVGQLFQDAQGNQYHVLTLPPLEDVESQRAKMYVFGYGYNVPPDYTVWASSRGDMLNYLTPVDQDI